MALKKLFDVAVVPFGEASDSSTVVLVLADTESKARLVVEEANRFSQIISVSPQPGLVAAVGPSRIIGRFSEQAA
jgi:hypothetical protein